MVSLSEFMCFYTLIFLIIPTFSQQSYDSTKCASTAQIPGSNYLCNSNKFPCDTYIVYRAQEGYQTLFSISSLFNTSHEFLLFSNNISEANFENLHLGQEIIVPVTCSCLGRFSYSVIPYSNSLSDSLYRVACEVFEGLVKMPVLMEQNRNFNGSNLVQVPIRCACPEASDVGNGTKFLVTYLVNEYDHMDLIARKFGVPPNMIWYANRLDPTSTIFTKTTLLIPTKEMPILNSGNASLPQYQSPAARPVILDISHGSKSNNTNLLIFLGRGLPVIFFLVVFSGGVLVYIRRRNHPQSFQPFSSRSSPLSKFSPDLLDGMSKLKHSLISFSLEELRIATEDFSQNSVIGKAVYRGRIGGSHLAIEEMSTEEAARHVIAILTKINHLNVVKLEGCCYGIRPYLVYEFVENGSLRENLTNPKRAKQLTWGTRLQIVSDLAMGLHYLHYCTQPTYVHRNINSKNVLITVDGRAKISGFRLAKPIMCTDEKEELNWNESVRVGRKGYLAPEYLTYGQASIKVDVYSFGVVLLELLSAKDAIENGSLLKDSKSFLTDEALGDSSGCLENLKKFMDPALLGEYKLGDATCLALLAKGCVEENPLRRPTMNDVLKALSRIL